MRLRPWPIALTCSLLSITACSSPAGLHAVQTSATPTPTPRTTIGTVEPIADKSGLEEAGLTKATMSIQAEENAVVIDDDGVVYVAPRQDKTADLSVHRVLWDGTETWSASVPVPAGAAEMRLRMSHDPGLGAVAVWFSDPSADPSTPGTVVLRHTDPLSSATTWFDVASGQQTSQDLRTAQEEASASRSDTALVGAVHMVDQNTTSGMTYLGKDRTFTTTDWSELGIGEGTTLSTLNQWSGTPVVGTGALAGTDGALQLGATRIASAAHGALRTTYGSTHMVVTPMEEGHHFWLVDQAGAATEVSTTGSCNVDLDHTGSSSVSSSHAYLGLLRVSLADGTTECLADASPDADLEIAGGFSDGSLLLTEPTDIDSSMSWLVPADQSQPLAVGHMGLVRVRSDHIIDEVPLKGTTTINAFDYRDLLPQK
ncbi:hypothetical protein [Actinomyces viscosus]|uniref:hypothetical protein n=1 Tax=Actinomyces viscosus TaxID=1656 RepID=UPI0028E2AD50|nr:hypothetical protein [Actinomyces viscosus]